MDDRWVAPCERMSRRDGVGFYFRARLHRRLFLWLAAAIMATFAVVFFVLRHARGGFDYRRYQQGALRFVAGQTQAVWDSPGKRQRVLYDMAQHLSLPAQVLSQNGEVLDAALFPSECRSPLRSPVVHSGQTLGQVEVCFDRAFGAAPLQRSLLALLAALTVLWAAAGLVARRILSPLRELVEVARQLGEGHLEKRANLQQNQVGEVGELALALNDMAARIEKQIKDQRELLAAVSHELRTPLTRIRLLTEMARDGNNQHLSEIEEEIIEMDRLVGELLAHARLDFSALSRTQVSGSDLAKRAVERAGLPETRIVSQEVMISADATLLSRALLALLDNAKKHGTPPITLRVSRHDDQVRFAVEDQGKGFSTTEQNRAFEPFVRGKQDGGGLGLGLSLVQRIAQAHGGSAFATNGEEGGASVGFVLPLTSPSPHTP